VVGECKATKSEKVPDGTPAQLIKLGHKHLQEQYDRCIKLIVAAGELTSAAQRTAVGNKINIIRPETLQSLVELQAQHKGCIDLLKLKHCLQQEPFGLADDKINSCINKIKQNIKLRADIVQLVKTYLKKTGNERVSVHSLYGAYAISSQPQPLKPEALHEILVELSSPLTGYLGRTNGRDGSDRFYFLRDLQVD
jgi:predicted unusual protein kinase regulating ubiquinone biosynthesis (AarF/ABC1/UbiB family)